MSIATKFSDALRKALEELEHNEWSVAQARKECLQGLSTSDAFHAVVPVLELAMKQPDPYAIQSCIWFALDLACASQTTEIPGSLTVAVRALVPIAQKHEIQDDLQRLLSWYRLPLSASTQSI